MDISEARQIVADWGQRNATDVADYVEPGDEPRRQRPGPAAEG